MHLKDDSETEAVMTAISSLAAPDGVRVHEICGTLSAPIAPARVVALLQQQVRVGKVRHNPLSGRWSIVGASVPPPPTARRPAGFASPTPGGGATPASLPAVEDHGIPTERDDDGVVDASQRAVVRAEPTVRQVVTAGPGFGKTAVACGRVAWLLRGQTEPARILLLSFTRTAVREMRARIAAMAGAVEGANAVDIRTIDSFAWRVRTGLTESPKPGQGYALNIDETVAMVKAPSDELREYLDAFDHVIVDEAQDLVGPRAVLVVAMLGALRPDAGWTVFLDPAQAIYDWSDDSGGVRGPQPSFEEFLTRVQPPPVWRVLEHLHRTRDPALRALLLGARKLVLDAPADACTRLRNVLLARSSGEACFATKVADAVLSRAAGRDDLLLLARRRGEALELSARLTEQGIPHRLRFGALPQLAAPWIAAVLNEACQSTGSTRVVRRDVEDGWESVARVNSWLTEGWDIDRAWRLLRRIGAGSTKHSIDIGRIAARLAGASVPDDTMLREIGGRGPVVSTVHGSKGREAAEAVLLLTSQGEDDPDEARVLYVGLSRAKERLDIMRFAASRWRHLDGSGRPWRKTRENRVQIEIGRAGDLDLRLGVRVTDLELRAQQQLLGAFDGLCRKVKVHTFMDRGPARQVVPEDSQLPLATLSKGCVEDLRAAAQHVLKTAKTPLFVNHLRWFDVGSVGLPPDFVLDVPLPEPWQSTRLFLAPIVVGPGVFGGIK